MKMEMIKLPMALTDKQDEILQTNTDNHCFESTSLNGTDEINKYEIQFFSLYSRKCKHESNNTKPLQNNVYMLLPTHPTADPHTTTFQLPSNLSNAITSNPKQTYNNTTPNGKS